MSEKPERKRGSMLTFITFALVFLILFNQALYTRIGEWVGIVLNPVFGFGGRYPVLTVMLAGTLMVMLTTLIRHFTTDWLEMARGQAVMREFQKEFSKARKENNTYRIKKLQEQQPQVMQQQQAMQMKQMRMMPMTMLVVIPLFAWVITFLTGLDYRFFSAPWNPTVTMFGRNGVLFGSSLFPHWILLYMCLSVPLGALVQKGMKYISWKERWKDRHPEVHE